MEVPQTGGFKCLLCGEVTDQKNWVIMWRYVFVKGKIEKRTIQCCRRCFDVSEELMKSAEAVVITTWLLASKVDLEKLPGEEGKNGNNL